MAVSSRAGPWLEVFMLTPSRPILTPKTVLPLFFVIGIIFAPIGGLLLYASAQVPAPPIRQTFAKHLRF